MGDAMQPPDPAGLAPSPASFAAQPPEIVETHVSIVVLVGDRAYKLKKPIMLPFLDWRSREARGQVCHDEVALNRRLTPDVYLGVADVVDAEGRLCDHLVVMRRMPAERRLSRLVREGAELHAALDELAALVARFHAGARRAPEITEAAGRDAVRRNWDDNLAALREHTGTLLDAAVVEQVGELAHRYLAGREPLFRERGEAGLAVDGHGDLLADDVYVLDDGPRVLDCLEFSAQLRAVDVLDDVAFLAMDLERLGAPQLARHFLDAYDRHSGERHPPSLAHHFVAYRAGVRSKVACVRADQGAPDAASEARTLLDLAHAHLREGRVRLVLVGGLPGTGKSTLAHGIAARAGWAVLRSDVVRKELVGAPPETRLGAAYRAGIYSAEHTAATYRELLARASHLLARGESVVIDASWTDPAWRDAAASVAADTASELATLCCVAPADVAAARMVRRAATAVADASDATPDIAAAMARDAPPWPDATTIDTAGSPEASLQCALRALGVAGDPG